MHEQNYTQYITFDREGWRRLRLFTPLTISETDLMILQGVNECISLNEVSDVYLPLSRLLNLYVSGAQNLYELTHTFLGIIPGKVPYIIGIAGSVAVGKSTTARIIQALLSHWPTHPKVDLVTTDGFLYPNEILEKKGLMSRKGFPESYDIRRLLEFLNDIKSGVSEVSAPVYSHLAYNIVPETYQIISKPDILLVEGLNVLQTPKIKKSEPGSQLYISDFFDFTIYVHAEIEDIKRWYVERFNILRRTAFQEQNSYFHRFAELSENEAACYAEKIWSEINEVNLKENIYPTQQRAQMILEKGYDHSIQKIRLRKL